MEQNIAHFRGRFEAGEIMSGATVSYKPAGKDTQERVGTVQSDGMIFQEHDGVGQSYSDYLTFAMGSEGEAYPKGSDQNRAKRRSIYYQNPGSPDKLHVLLEENMPDAVENQGAPLDGGATSDDGGGRAESAGNAEVQEEALPRAPPSSCHPPSLPSSVDEGKVLAFEDDKEDENERMEDD